MTDNDLTNRTWDDVLGSVEGIANSATKLQMQSIMAVPAKATLEIGRDLRNASEQIRKFNESTTRLTKVLIWLNFLLLLTAVLQVISAFIR